MADFSRRAFLQGNLAAVVLAYLAEQGYAPADQPGAAFGPAAIRDTTPNPPWDGTTTTAPYTLDASATMSQDYFQTDLVSIDADADLVAPFVHADGSVAALIVSGDNIASLSRDSTAPTGWAYDVVFSSQWGYTGVSAIAAGTASDGTVYGAILTGTGDRATDADPALYWIQWTPANGWQWTGVFETDIDPATTEITAHRALDGQVYFTIWDADNTLHLWAPELAWNPITITAVRGQPYTNPQLIWSGSAPADATCGIAATGTEFLGERILAWCPQTGSGLSSAWGPWEGAAIAGAGQIIDIVPAPGSLPTALMNQTGSLGWVPGLFGVPSSTGGFGAVDAVYTWGPDTGRSIMAIGAGTVSVMSVDDGTGAPVVELEEAVAALYGPTAPALDAAFVAVEEGTGFLSILAKDPTTGIWSRTPVHQPATDVLDISAWRVQLTLQDANGVPVSGQDIVVTPDRAVAMWQVTGSAVAAPDSPVTRTTDDYGRVTLAFPVLELDAPGLTVLITDKDGVTTQEFQVAPDGEVHGYLLGTGTLLGKPAFDGAALQSATDSSGAPVVPGVSADSADAAATAMTNCMKVGKGTIDTSQVQSFTVNLTGGTASYSESSSASAFFHLLPGGGPAGNVGSDLSKDLKAIEHAIRNAVRKVSQVVAHYLGEAEGWAISLALDINETVTFVVDGVRAAITAIHGILNAIGADISKAIKWLRMVFDDILGEAEAHAKLLTDVIVLDMPQALRTLADDLANLADGYFSGLQGAILSDLEGDFGTSVAAGTLSAATGAPPEGGSGGVIGDDEPVGDSTGGGSTGISHNWLFEKIQKEWDDLKQDDSGLWDDTEGLFGQLWAALGDLGELAATFAEVIWEEFKTLLTPTTAKGMAFTRLVSVMHQLVARGTALADQLVGTFVSMIKAIADLIEDFVNTPIAGLGLLGALLSKLGVSSSLTLGHVFALLITFPMTLVNRLATGAPMDVPQRADSASGVVATTVVDTWGKYRLAVHGSARALHSIIDLVDDFATATSGDDKAKPNKWVSGFDAFTSLALGAVTWPAPKVDGKTPPPFTTDLPRGTQIEKLTLAHWALSVAGPGIGLLIFAVRLGTAQRAPSPNPTATPYGLWMPWVNMLTFAATLGTGVYLDWADTTHVTEKDKIVAYAETITEVLPRVLSPLATQYINSPADELPLAIKAVVDAMQLVSAGFLFKQMEDVT